VNYHQSCVSADSNHGLWCFGGTQLDQSLLDEQSKIYKVEGVDESAPAAPAKKRKQLSNGDEVRTLLASGPITIAYDLSALGPSGPEV
jgi:hypothetical protein